MNCIIFYLKWINITKSELKNIYLPNLEINLWLNLQGIYSQYRLIFTTLDKILNGFAHKFIVYLWNKSMLNKNFDCSQ